MRHRSGPLLHSAPRRAVLRRAANHGLASLPATGQPEAEPAAESPSRWWRRISACTLGGLLLTALPQVSFAQQLPDKAQEETNIGAEVPEAIRAETLRALKLAQEQDLEGAIAILEPLHEEGKAPPLAVATLGTLYLELGLVEDAFAALRPIAEHPDANAAVLYNAGRAAVELGLADLGETFLARSVALQPLSPAARMLGLLKGARGEAAVAYPLLRPWALQRPEDHEARLGAAVGAIQLGRVEEAEELLVGLPDEDPKVQLLRADLLRQRQRGTEAIQILEGLSGEMPAAMEVDVYSLLAELYLEAGRSGEAVTLLSERAAGRPRLVLALARAQYRGGDAEAALATLEPLIQALPQPGTFDPGQKPPGWGVMASVALEQGRLLVATDRAKEALTPLELAAMLEPFRRDVWQELARARQLSGDEAGAEQAMAKWQELAEAKERAKVPGLAGRRRQEDATGSRLAEALEWIERGDSERALTMVRQEISLAPEDPRPRLLEVRTLLQLGRAKEALGSADSAVQQFPDSTDVLHFRAVARLSTGDLDGAESDLRQVLEQAGGHLPAMNDLALVHQRRGDLEEARAWLEKVLAIAPQDPLARQRLNGLQAAADGVGG